MRMLATECVNCATITSADIYRAKVTSCPNCGGQCEPIGRYMETKSNKNTVTVNVQANGLSEIEEQLQRINELVKQTFVIR